MNDNCVFCDRSKFEERIVAEDENFWLIATLGQISDGGYVLIVPKRHAPCLGALTEDEITRFERFEARVCGAVHREYRGSCLVFEHGIVGQTVKHAHLHIVPACVSLTNKISSDFPSSEIIFAGSYYGLTRRYAGNPQPYLLWRDCSHVPRLCFNPLAPPQYLRTILAEAVGRPERANWRNMDPVLDRELWSETVSRLKPHLA